MNPEVRCARVRDIGKRDEMKYCSTLTLDWGTIVVEADDEAITAVYLEMEPLKAQNFVENRWTKQGKQQLKEYFDRERKEFELPLKMVGTPFQLCVWEALQTIPYGHCISYKEVCRRIQNERAFQAVGTAIGKNPFFIVVPCHRVISSDGTIGGFSYGLGVKRRLFEVEKIQEKI